MTITDTDTPEKYTPIPVEIGQPILGTPVNPNSTEAQPFLEVVAPATLPEGYTFDAVSNGQSFAVKVPAGGVEEGQKFSVPIHSAVTSSPDASGDAVPRPSIPTGKWRDDLCDCCTHGVCHPSFCHACWCPLALLGQVMRRLRLNCFGNEAARAQTTSTFHILLGVSIAYALIEFMFDFLEGSYSVTDGYGNTARKEGYEEIYITHEVISLIYLIFSVVIIAKTRKRIRDRYDIPETTCRGCEDCCCAFWCECCTVAQMARHTADYETYAARCCSEPGLPANAPEISARAPEIPAHILETPAQAPAAPAHFVGIV